jgi:hypothetical protein
MWLAAFHLLVTLHHAYTFVLLRTVNFSGATDRYLIAMKDMGFRFFTVWNLVSDCLHIVMWYLVSEGLLIAI